MAWRGVAWHGCTRVHVQASSWVRVAHCSLIAAGLAWVHATCRAAGVEAGGMHSVQYVNSSYLWCILLWVGQVCAGRAGVPIIILL